MTLTSLNLASHLWMVKPSLGVRLIDDSLFAGRFFIYGSSSQTIERQIRKILPGKKQIWNKEIKQIGTNEFY
jgi:hypothetical protein